jgi:nucleotide-binding universal stress UspA family protein
MMFLSAFLADLAGVKAIVGAFLAGLAFNRIIPRNSVLMNRLIFIGNTLFIPFFLISAGMLVDLRLFFVSTNELVFAGILSGVALLTKFFAAQLTGFIYKYTKYERRIIYGLSASHAAATLAVIKVGFDIGLLDQHAINGTIILILITCMVSSFVTERAARQLAIEEKDADVKIKKRPERILIPISNPENMQRLLEFALLIKDDKSQEPIYPLTVVEDDTDADVRLQSIRKATEAITDQLVSSEKKIEILKKVDLNIVDGIARTAKAYGASHILLSSKAAHTTGNFLFGNVADNLLVKTEQTVLLAKILQPLNSFARIVVRFTPNACLELSFKRTVQKIAMLLRQLGDDHIVIGDEKTLEQFKNILNDREGNFYIYKLISDNEQETEKELRTDDLLVVISSRKQTVSYDFYTDNLQDSIVKSIESQSFIIIYPEILDAAHHFTEMETAPFQENIELIRKAKDKIKDIFKR